MESDFTTRHHLDSVVPFSDPGIGDLLHKYRNPPVEPKPLQFSGNQGFHGDTQGSSASNVYISNMLGQLQGVVQAMSGANKEPPNLAGSGMQLSINADILRWMLVLAFAIVLVVVLFQFMSKRKAKNPLKKRLRRLENEIKAFRMKNPVPALKQVDSEDEAEADDAEDDAEDYAD